MVGPTVLGALLCCISASLAADAVPQAAGEPLRPRTRPTGWSGAGAGPAPQPALRRGLREAEYPGSICRPQRLSSLAPSKFLLAASFMALGKTPQGCADYCATLPDCRLFWVEGCGLRRCIVFAEANKDYSWDPGTDIMPRGAQSVAEHCLGEGSEEPDTSGEASGLSQCFSQRVPSRSCARLVECWTEATAMFGLHACGRAVSIISGDDVPGGAGPGGAGTGEGREERGQRARARKQTGLCLKHLQAQTAGVVWHQTLDALAAWKAERRTTEARRDAAHEAKLEACMRVLLQAERRTFVGLTSQCYESKQRLKASAAETNAFFQDAKGRLRLKEGMQVQARSEGLPAEWFWAKITDVHADGTCDIAYYPSNEVERRVPRRRIRPTDEAARLAGGKTAWRDYLRRQCRLEAVAVVAQAGWGTYLDRDVGVVSV